MTELTEGEARRLTDRIRAKLADGLLDLIAEAFHGRADVALGYGSWDRYCHAEFPAVRFTDLGDRQEAVAKLKDEGMSNRAIGHALHMDEKTVRGDLKSGGYGESRTAGNPAVHPGVSLDGKMTGGRASPRCKPMVVQPTVKISPLHFARQVASLLAEMDQQHYGPDDLTAEQLRITGVLRGALQEFVMVFEEAEAAQR